MALELVANEDMMIEFSNTLPGGGALTYLGDQGIDLVMIVPTLSTKCKANSKKVGTTGITLAFAVGGADCPHTFTGHTFVSGAGTVAVSATKCKAESALVLREGDTGTCIGSWTNDATAATVVCNCDVSISDAGQTKVKAQ